MKIKKIMQAITLADRKGLTEEQWLDVRRLGIGGSDAGAICGVSPFSSPFAVYAEKLGIYPPKPVSEAMRIGNDLEEYVAQRFIEKSGKKVKRCNYILQAPKHPFMIADVDRLIVGENAGLECKTTSAYNKTDFTAADVPPHYYAQCIHYMAVTGAERWYLAVLVLGIGFFTFVIERNENDIAALIKLEEDFWKNNVLARVEPEADGSAATTEALKNFYEPTDSGTFVDLTPYEGLIEEYLNLAERKKLIEREQERLKQEIQIYMANATEGGVGEYKVTWRYQTRTSLDTKALKAENPDLYARYAKTTEARPFTVSAAKREA